MSVCHSGLEERTRATWRLMILPEDKNRSGASNCPLSGRRAGLQGQSKQYASLKSHQMQHNLLVMVGNDGHYILLVQDGDKGGGISRNDVHWSIFRPELVIFDLLCC